MSGPKQPSDTGGSAQTDLVLDALKQHYVGKGGKDPTVITPLSGEGSRPSYGAGWVTTAFGAFPEASR